MVNLTEDQVSIRYGPKAPPAETPSQQYVLSELRKIHGAILIPEEVREKAERLEEALRFEANSAVKRELRTLHRAPLVEEDRGVLRQYRLGGERRESEERRQRSEAEGTPRVACSEAVLYE